MKWAVTAALLLAFLAAVSWQWWQWGKDREAFLPQIASGAPADAMVALNVLRANPRVEDIELRSGLKEQPRILELFERGPSGVAEDRRRGATIVEAAELLLPLSVRLAGRSTMHKR